MGPLLPSAIPQIPVRDMTRALDYYTAKLGFTFDWHDHRSGLAGISQGECRLFLNEPAFRHDEGDSGSEGIVIWLNLNNRQEVDELYLAWKQTGAEILAAPEDKPWNLREFTASDPDGNRIRVFYDFTGDQ